MARKKRKDEKEEEEYEFVPPEFDEKSFLEKDIVGTKALMVTALLAIIFGIIAFFVGKGIQELVGFVVLIAGGVFLQYYAYRLFKINQDDVARNTKLGNIALYVLLSLGIWILLMNPPFS